MSQRLGPFEFDPAGWLEFVRSGATPQDQVSLVHLLSRQALSDDCTLDVRELRGYSRRIRNLFPDVGDGRCANMALMRQWQTRQERAAAMSDRNRKAADARWGKRRPSMPSVGAESAWKLITDELRRRVTGNDYKRFFRDGVGVGLSSDELTVKLPSIPGASVGFVAETFQVKIFESIRWVGLNIRRVAFVGRDG